MTSHNHLTANRNIRKQIVNHLREIPEGEEFLLDMFTIKMLQEKPNTFLSVKRVGAIIREFQDQQFDERGGALPVVRYIAPYVWQRIPCDEVAE